MGEIEIEEVVQHKMLPFSIEDLDGNQLIKAGEIITPGKIMLLKNKKLFKSPIVKNTIQINNNNSSIIPTYLKQTLIEQYKNIINEIKNDNLIPEIKLEKLSSDIMVLIEKNYKKAKYLSQFQIYPKNIEYLGLNIAIIATIISEKIGLDIAERIKLIKSSLLANISKKENDIQNYSIHMLSAYNLLKNSNLDEENLNIILNHHENIDGTGYPSRIDAQLIPINSMIINICEFFVDIIGLKEISNYKDAYKKLLSESNNRFSKRILYSLIHSFEYGDISEIETKENEK